MLVQASRKWSSFMHVLIPLCAVPDTVAGLKQMHGGQLPGPEATAQHSSLLHSWVYFLVNAKCMWQDPDPKSLQWIDCALRA